MYENMRLQLEKCDDSKDIVVFIHSKQTGSEIPCKSGSSHHFYSRKYDPDNLDLPIPRSPDT